MEANVNVNSLEGLERWLVGKVPAVQAWGPELSSSAPLQTFGRFLKTFWGCHTVLGNWLMAASGVKPDALFNIP